jgi:hypothetical protein
MDSDFGLIRENDLTLLRHGKQLLRITVSFEADRQF